MTRNAYYYTSCAVAQVLAALLNIAAANASGQVYLRVETTPTEANGYTANVFQNAIEEPAAALVLFLTYDNHQVTLLPADASVNHVQLAQQQQQAGFIISETLYEALDDSEEKSCLAVAIYKTSDTIGLSPGALFSFQLQIAPNLDTPAQIEAATADSPIQLNGSQLTSSASTADEVALPLFFETASIVGNCAQPPAPREVKASRRYRDKIIITWAPPQYENPLEYKLYRAISDDIAEAIPLNMPYTTDTTWTDSFTVETIEPPPAGCNCTLIQYYYWVRVQLHPAGGLSPFSAPPARGALRN